MARGALLSSHRQFDDHIHIRRGYSVSPITEHNRETLDLDAIFLESTARVLHRLGLSNTNDRKRRQRMLRDIDGPFFRGEPSLECITRQ